MKGGILLVLVLIIKIIACERSFKIGWNENTFLKDGKPFRYVSGAIHYFRVPCQYWEDRLLKLKAAGLNAVETYIEWKSHEPQPDQYDFEGNNDFITYIKIANKLGLYVILRPGPYIDAEREMGGLPYWLLANDSIALRTMDSNYIKYVDKWFDKLLPMIKPLLYVNGGNIITIQVENEYGSYYACDRDYVSYLYDKIRNTLGNDILLFTTDGDGPSFLKCGPTMGAYATVDFGSGVNVSYAFSVQRTKEIAGPLVNSEYYTGWLDHWGYPHQTTSTKNVVTTLDQILATNASVNFYMFHGGTSFGFSAGSNLDGDVFDVCPTSYDYDAPLNEAGDITPKYDAIKSVLSKYMKIPNIKVQRTSPKLHFGPVYLTPSSSSMLDTIRNLSTPVTSQHPLRFEELGHGYGFVLYETKITERVNDPITLNVSGIRDRGYVYIDNVYQGVLSRSQKVFSTSVSVTPNQTLSLLVENQGRICVGTSVNDTKGILGNVTLGSLVLSNWTMYAPNLDALNGYVSNAQNLSGIGTSAPGFFSSTFKLPNNTIPADTFLKLDGWTKGVAWINGFNLGVYWPVIGPQVTMYVPGVLLKNSSQENNLVLMELQESPCTYAPKAGCFVKFVDTPILNGSTPIKAQQPQYLLVKEKLC